MAPETVEGSIELIYGAPPHVIILYLLSSPVPGYFPVRGIRPFWNRPPPAPVPMPVPGGHQPRVFVQHQPEQQRQQRPPAQASPRPRERSAPEPEVEVPQCPVCKALMPSSVNREEHVNSHFE